MTRCFSQRFFSFIIILLVPLSLVFRYVDFIPLDYQAAILHDSPPKDELTTPQHCPRRSSLSASADAPFTQVQTSRDRLDLGHPCFHSAYLQAVALKPDNAPSRLHDRTTTNDYLKMATDEWEQNTLINVAMPLTNLPPYNEQNTKNWFLQLEAIFSVRRITSQQAKFANVVQVLPPSVVDEVADILEHVPEQEPYTRLKDAILKRTGRSDEELLRELFTHVTRGDRTPSQLLRFMRSRLGKHSMAESILRELWMDKLPTTITQILAPIADNTPLDQLANSADRIATKLDQGVCAVQRPDDTSAKETDLEKAVADLQHQLQDIRMLLSRTSRGPMPATGGWRRRARSTSRGRRVDPELCWYHHRFGTRAKNCSAPCKYSSKTKSEN
ncbi:unnamed protein product [Acanthosepion pharaonis]|uniref:DUF7041 domain-containing protein n=1 Tax=Acanthosepion pharaonis TaxID=158019 RepID=A0A812DH11_ACAPH|nr:unnamed protein product [Sepia pharaonis]